MSACVRCGAELQPGARECKRCGAEVPGAGARSAGIAPNAPAANARPSLGEDPVLLQLQRSLASVYKVERRLGRGETGTVYQAVEIALNRPVALKVLPPGLGLGAAAARFKREARIAAGLDHLNIVPIYRVGLIAGSYFFAMKLVDGRALDAILESQGALPLPAVLAVLKSAAGALAYANERGAIHGDIKAANILVDRDGRVMLSDFGIARAVEEETLPAAGPAVRKPRLSSPEQAIGGGVTQQSDQYSLGVVAYHMITGSVPSGDDSLATVPDVRTVRAGLPDALVRVVQTAVAKDPAQRYESTADMYAAIEAIPFSGDERGEADNLLRLLARGEPVARVRAPSPPPRADAKTVTRAAAIKAASAAEPVAPAAPAAKPAPSAPAQRVVPTAPAAKPAPTAPAQRAAPVTPTAPAAKPAPAPPAAKPAPTAPAQRPAATVPAPKAAPPAPAPKPAPPAPAQRVTPTVPATPAMRAPQAAPVAPTVPEMPAMPETPAAPAARATPPERVVKAAPAEPEPKRHSHVALLVAAVLVVVVLAAAAYWVLGRRPAAAPIAQAPVRTQTPMPAQPAAVAAVPAAAESARSDTAHRVRAATDTARADTSQATGLLLLNTVPDSAEILIDGHPAGARGFVDVEVPAGHRHLRISAPGYVTLDTVITVRADATVNLGQIALAGGPPAVEAAPAPAAPATGRLRLRTVPPTAEIFVDNQSVGFGSLLDFEVPAGQRQLRISAPGYVTLDTLITVDGGATVRLGQVALKTSGGGP